MNKVYTKSKEDLDKLYADSSLTWEGLDESDENLEAVVNWLNTEANCGMIEETFYITSGELMNYVYDLTGENAYPNDLTIVSVMLKDLDKLGSLPLKRFEVGARWFDDIVDNNLRREGFLM